MLLPGGLEGTDGLQRSWSFRPRTGLLEMDVLESLREEAPAPMRITGALASSLRSISARDADAEVARRLSVGDRQFLILQLAVHLEWYRPWRTFPCGHCGTNLDVFVDAADIPIKPAGAGYPRCEVGLTFGRFLFRVPEGADQELAATCSSDEEAMRALLDSCLLECLEGSWDADRCLDELGTVEDALEETAPMVGTGIETECPECFTAGEYEIDLCEGLESPAGTLLDQIHQIASTYHWTEQGILALPSSRRLEYLRRIDRRKGLTS